MRRDKAFAITFSYLFLFASYATLHPAMSVRRLVGWSVPFWAAAPKGPMTYAFTQEKFLLLLLLLLHPPPSKLILLR